MKPFGVWTGVLLALVGSAAVGAEDEARPAGSRRATYRNPLIDCPGAADPAVLRYEGKYYLYPTLDSTGYDVFVSEDLVNWERRPKC